MTETTVFHQKIAELEALVKQLEQPGQKLEESIGAFERGMKLLTECHTALAQAKQRVEVVQRQSEKIVTVSSELDAKESQEST